MNCNRYWVPNPAMSGDLFGVFGGVSRRTDTVLETMTDGTFASTHTAS